MQNYIKIPDYSSGRLRSMGPSALPCANHSTGRYKEVLRCRRGWPYLFRNLLVLLDVLQELLVELDLCELLFYLFNVINMRPH